MFSVQSRQLGDSAWREASPPMSLPTAIGFANALSRSEQVPPQIRIVPANVGRLVDRRA
jgi:hypothetical protein